MGIKNTHYDRVTVYLKNSQKSFLNELIKDLENKGVSVPSRSDLIRAIIDEATGDTDWKSRSLVEAINEFKKQRYING
jgi:Arc/MetJ-type ribon-helix-helix transcriptional regulator